MDLADFVSAQGLAAGRNAAPFVQGKPLETMPPETSNAMAKGLPQPGTITCILCPKGCRVTVEADGKVTGNSCPKGEEYARQEIRAPMRVLTTTLKRPAGTLLPVKTSKAIPKGKLQTCAARLRTVTAPAGAVRCGEILLKDPFGLGADVIAAGDA